jgi:hypothetical protein
MNTNKLTIDFEGSIQIDPSLVEFINIETEEIIDGNQYLNMDENLAQNFIIKSMCDVIQNSENTE